MIHPSRTNVARCLAILAVFSIWASLGVAAEEALPLSTFKKNFPEGVEVPKALVKLLEFQNHGEEFYSGHFALSDESTTAMSWFDRDKAAASQFIFFGGEADGSSFGFWIYKGRKLEDAPIVYLKSEGDCTVMANSLEEFLALLAAGAFDSGDSAINVAKGKEGADFKEDREPAKRLGEFRGWLKNQFKGLPTDKPKDIVIRARKNHPDLKAWVTEWQKSHERK